MRIFSNTLITSASISGLEPLRREAVAAERAEKLISAAVAAATGIASNGNNVLHGTPTSMEAAEVQLARLVLDVELRVPLPIAHAQRGTKSDSETVAEFRSLGAKVSGAGPEPSMFGVGDASVVRPAPPRFRSLSAHYEVGDDGQITESHATALASVCPWPRRTTTTTRMTTRWAQSPSIVESRRRPIPQPRRRRQAPGGRARGGASPDAPEPAPTPSRHLMRLMSATPKRAASVGA